MRRHVWSKVAFAVSMVISLLAAPTIALAHEHQDRGDNNGGWGGYGGGGDRHGVPEFDPAAAGTVAALLAAGGVLLSRRRSPHR